MSTQSSDVLEELTGSRDSKQAILLANVHKLRASSAVMDRENPLHADLRQYVPGTGAKEPKPAKPEERFVALEHVVSLLGEQSVVDEPLYLLLQGGTGSGKSALLRYLEYTLWSQHDSDNEQLVPLFISLAQLADPEHQAVEETMASCGVSAQGIAQLKATCRFVFLLDGFDELGKPVNLYHSNSLSTWNAHVIVGARSQYLQSLSEYSSLFTTPKQSAVNERFLLPFEPDQVDLYLQRFALSSESSEADWRAYRQLIDATPGLLDLVTTPFLLRMACISYTSLKQGVPSEGLTRCLTKSVLYDTFLEIMLQRELWRCVSRRLLHPTVLLACGAP